MQEVIDVIREATKYAMEHQGMDSLTVSINQVNDAKAGKNAICTATCKCGGELSTLSSLGEGKTLKEAELKAKINVLRELTGLDIKLELPKKEERVIPEAKVNVPMPTVKPAAKPTQKTVAKAPVKKENNMDPKDKTILRTLIEILGYKKADCEQAVVEWSAGNWKTREDITAENVKAFNLWLKRKAAEKMTREEIDSKIQESLQKAGIE